MGYMVNKVDQFTLTMTVTRPCNGASYCTDDDSDEDESANWCQLSTLRCTLTRGDSSSMTENSMTSWHAWNGI